MPSASNRSVPDTVSIELACSQSAMQSWSTLPQPCTPAWSTCAAVIAQPAEAGMKSVWKSSWINLERRSTSLNEKVCQTWTEVTAYSPSSFSSDVQVGNPDEIAL